SGRHRARGAAREPRGHLHGPRPARGVGPVAPRESGRHPAARRRRAACRCGAAGHERKGGRTRRLGGTDMTAAAFDARRNAVLAGLSRGVTETRHMLTDTASVIWYFTFPVIFAIVLL